MATITKTKDETFRVGWWEHPEHASEGDRKVKRSIYLGRISKRSAEEIRSKLSELIDSRDCGVEPPAAAVKWLSSVPAGKLRDALTKHGFRSSDYDRRTRTVPTLRDWIASFIERQKPTWRDDATTESNYRQTERWAAAYFGDRMLLTELQPSNISAWRAWMQTPDATKKRALVANGASKHLKRMKTILEAAVEEDWFPKNPAKKEKCPAEISKGKIYIPRDEFLRVLAEAPNDEWRCVLTLARVGGLRVPSELQGLEWEGVSWSAQTLRIISPKGENDGKGVRIAPLFPELREVLERLWEAAPVGARWILPTFRDRGAEANLRQGVLRMTSRAGVHWPEPFRSMRSSAATDLHDHFPSHVVVAWMGHTELTAERHYLQTTRDHIDRAVTLRTDPPADPRTAKKPTRRRSRPKAS